MKDAILFKTRYDPGRLASDLEAAIRACEWIYKPERGKYIKWSAIPLHALHGGLGLEAINDRVWIEDAASCAPTPILHHCPYFAEIIGAWGSPRLRVRLMRLEVSGRIGLHRDAFCGWDQPMMRLHVPITTHAGVDFRLNDKKIVMAPGEVWYLDTTKEHEVYNPGPTDRVHLVIDLVNTPELREELGPGAWERYL